jgi:hypothetical protein
LDQLAHRFGTSSQKWLNTIEELDSVIGRFAKLLPKSAGAILTADHGVIDVPKTSHIYLDEYESMQNLLMVGGDPRVGFAYFESNVDLELKRANVEAELGSLVDLASVQELVDAGWYQPLTPTASALAPDLILLPKGERVVYHRDFAKPKSLEMIGQHGGMSKAEWEVPLISL